MSTSFQTVLSETKSGVCVLTLNRPEVYNAFNEQMKKDMNDALKEAEQNQTARCVVIRGAGDKAFCSGQDLKEHAGSKRSLKESLEKSYNPMIRRIRTMEKPVIGMINGVAAGAGCSLALACDMRVMSSNAKLIEVFIRIGLIPDSGSHWLLTRLTGMGRAFEYAATGRDISAEEAERAGLANKVVPPEKLEEEVMTLATRLAAGPTKAIGLIKRTLNKSLSADLDAILDYEAVLQQIASETEDHREGLAAFAEKRSATFKGK
ncbi:MAG TPA: enoyl-CoA hydratase-related protein [Bacteroidota bacterium]|nr:enoyl-CoA hydratase-related protein [Bacteroidota bacterium]